MRELQRLIVTSMLLMATGLGTMGAATAAESCPGNVTKVIVANPAGGIGDLVARAIAEKAATTLGHPFVIENRAGGATTIGTDYVAKSKPDGCTILSLTASGVVASVLRENLPYSLERDFAPIAGIGSFPVVMAVPASSKLMTFADLRAAIKSKDGITYASGGAGTLAHLSAVRLIRELGGKGNHVPYRGNPDALQGLLGDHVQLFFPSAAEVGPLVKDGKIRLLGVASEQRLASFPEVPTMKELGFAEFNPRLWYAFLAPANTPADAIASLRDGFVKAANDPSIRERLGLLGFTPEIRDGAAVSALMKSEAVRWSKVIKDNDIKSTD